MDVRRIVLTIPLLFGLWLVGWHAASAQSEVPVPNPLADVPPRFPLFASLVIGLPAVDLTANGRAVTIHGDPVSGRDIFAQRCAVCHGVRGTGGIPNLGSDDGTVPELNPAAEFIAAAPGDATTFAQTIDLFIQHGSRPAGRDPDRSMIPWGDRQLLSQEQIADVEAYVMQLNGLYWPDRWVPQAEIQMSATRSGNLVIYQMTLINHSSTQLGHLDLHNTLPTGLTYVSSYFPEPGQNPGDWTGTTIRWLNDDGIPPGGMLGPFVVTTQVQSESVPPNVSQLFFNWSISNESEEENTTYSSSAVSDAIEPVL